MGLGLGFGLENNERLKIKGITKPLMAILDILWSMNFYMFTVTSGFLVDVSFIRCTHNIHSCTLDICSFLWPVLEVEHFYNGKDTVGSISTQSHGLYELEKNTTPASMRHVETALKVLLLNVIQHCQVFTTKPESTIKQF